MLLPNDILLAFKAIALSEHLNGTEKQYAAFLVDSYNRKTGRCDPSEETAAFILGKSKRTIIRAGNRLVALKLFVRRKHAGHNHCNSYLPNWEMFRESERGYKRRRKDYANRFERPNLSPSECQSCHPSDDRPVTQTSLNNNIQLTSPGRPANQQPCAGDKGGLGNERKIVPDSQPNIPGLYGFKLSPSSRQAAETAAIKRWNNDLLRRYRSGPTYAAIVDALDPGLQQAATEAELKRRGGGLTCILHQLSLRQILPYTPGD
jgi:hypothetical protein